MENLQKKIKNLSFLYDLSKIVLYLQRQIKKYFE